MITDGDGNKRTTRHARRQAIALAHPQRSALPIIAWSFAWAAAIVGASLAHNYLTFPDITLWLVPFWFVGFAWLAGGSRREK